MQTSFFSGFQITQQAADGLCHLVSETKWRKLQKHFTVSLCFSCCRCDLSLFNLDLLYDHFSTVHQVDLSYIESLLKETEKDTVSSETDTFKLSENVIEDLIHLSESTQIEVASHKQNVTVEKEDARKKRKDIVSKSIASPDEPRRKGRPRKRSLQRKNKLTDAEVSDAGRKKSFPLEKTKNDGRKEKTDDGKTETNKCELSTKKSRIIDERIENLEKPHLLQAQDKIFDESEFTEEGIPVEFSKLVNDVVSTIVPTLGDSKNAPKRGIGRNMDSEEIKSKTCAICKEIQPSIKDCFVHYEKVHDYVPKSVYDKPPVDAKFEQSKARTDKRSKGRTKTDGNAEQCKFCGKMFLKDNIDKHIHLRHYWYRIERKEQRRQTVVCHLCGKLYHHKQNLEAHMAAVHRGKPRKKPPKSLSKPRVHICQNCGYTTPEIRRLKNHIAAHHEGVMPYQCDQCSFQTWEPSSWRCHKQRHSSEKKYKCTECTYQCIQRKQLRRHMSVKHQTILPKIWKRRDDGAFTNPHSNKFLQNDPEYMTVKQKQIQINRQLPPKSTKDGLYEQSTMKLDQNTVRVPAVSVPDQFGVRDSTENEVELVQLVPSVEISSLQQSHLGSYTEESVPTEVVITVANNSHFNVNKPLTSIANSGDGIPPTFQLDKVLQASEDIRKILSSPSTSRLPKESPMIIPPTIDTSSTGHNLRAVLQESPVVSQVVVLHGDEADPQMIRDADVGPRRRYYRPDFPLLQDIIQQQPNGPLFQKRNDGTVVYVPKIAKETKTDHDRGESLSKPSSGEVREIVEMYTNEPDNNPGSVIDGQSVIVCETTTEKMINLSSVHGNVSMYENSVTADDTRKTSPQFSHNQTSEVNFVALKTATTSTTHALNEDTSGSTSKAQPSIFSSDSEKITSLEQDIAQTLIQINPMSRLHSNKQGNP